MAKIRWLTAETLKVFVKVPPNASLKNGASA